MQSETEEPDAQADWTFRQEGAPPQALNTPFGGEVSWTASEYIAHQKGSSWYLSLGVGTVLLCGLIYLIVNDILTVVTIAVAALTFGFFGSRQPRTLSYRIDHTGITIGEKLYPYSILRSFSVQEDDPISSILITPLKRFLPAITVYYPLEQEEQIANTLSSYLPHEERPMDMIDRLMRKVRF